MLMNTSAALRHRAPPTAVKLLLPVWGERFVEQFLEFGLPTLLAPGNIPALAQMLPCEMVVMTSAENEATVLQHPLWRRLTEICGASIKHIDDLITDGNSSTTITLAYARTMREAGEKMLDTCFILLVSDYLVADGSLQTVLARVLDGASGVLAGNFQVVAEDAIDTLRQWLGSTPAALALSPRKLLKWAFAHLHPATAANIVNYGLNHNAHINRLFWRVDENTLVGRFYLMHMIGIRPEVTDFVVGSSCDYSFIPEMCPSGNVVALEDSDDYLVVEMQSRDHEMQHLRPGPIRERVLAESLVEWATQDHRQNISHTLIYHAADIPESVADVVVESDAFLAKVGEHLVAAPQPHRHHPYWLGAVSAHQAASGKKLSSEEWDFVLGRFYKDRSTPLRFLLPLRRHVYGYIPDVRPWHPNWPDFRLPLAALREHVGAAGEFLIVSESPDAYVQWLSRLGQPGRSLALSRLLTMSPTELAADVGKYGVCLLVITEPYCASADKLLRRISPLLLQSGTFYILVVNDRVSEVSTFGTSFAQHAGRFLDLSRWVSGITYVRSGVFRWALRLRLSMLGRRATTLRISEVPVFASAVGLMSVVHGLLSALMWRARPYPPRRGICSSIFLVLRPSAVLRSPLAATAAGAPDDEQSGLEASHSAIVEKAVGA